MNLILIAGLPATGKSRFASYLQQRLNIPLLCKDSIKEILFDTIGFQSHDEKTKLNHAGARKPLLRRTADPCRRQLRHF